MERGLQRRTRRTRKAEARRASSQALAAAAAGARLRSASPANRWSTPTCAATCSRRSARWATRPSSPGAPPFRRARQRSEVARRAAQDHLARNRRAQCHARPSGTASPSSRPSAERGRAATYFELLGAAKDPALAQKALDFALTGKAGTTSAAIIAARGRGRTPTWRSISPSPTGQGRSAGRCLGPRRSYYRRARRDLDRPGDDRQARTAARTVPEDEWRGIDRAIAAIRERLATEPGMAGEVGWLATRV